MNIRLAPLAIVLAAILTQTSHGSVQVNLDSNNAVTSIEDFEFMGMLFDITFDSRAYDTVFPTNDPYFRGQQPDSVDFNGLLADLLNGTPAVSLGGANIGLNPYSAGTTANANRVVFSSDWEARGLRGAFRDEPLLSGETWIVVERVVPEPSTIAVWSLLGLMGGAATLWRKRRKKNAA